MNNVERLMGVIRSPIRTEKSNALNESGQYVFLVAPSATKMQIKEAIKLMLSKDVDTVNTLNVRGKVKTRGRTIGTRKARKKAYITLKDGQTLDLVSAA